MINSFGISKSSGHRLPVCSSRGRTSNSVLLERQPSFWQICVPPPRRQQRTCICSLRSLESIRFLQNDRYLCQLDIARISRNCSVLVPISGVTYKLRVPNTKLALIFSVGKDGACRPTCAITVITVSLVN